MPSADASGVNTSSQKVMSVNQLSSGSLPFELMSSTSTRNDPMSAPPVIQLTETILSVAVL
jgi:hypothetical protein